jgi:peptide/nickel transport system substrate-binding protein
MNYAIDKDSLVKNVYKGLTKPEQGQVLQSTTVGFNPNVKPYPYDVAKAKSLLAQAGYPNGFNMKIEVYNTSPELEPTYLFVQNQLKDVGINADLHLSADSAYFLDRWYGRVARPNMLTVSLLNSPAMDADFALVWFKGNGTDTNQRFYQNPDFDAAYTASTTELDPAKRSDLLQKAVSVMNDDPPYLFLVEGFDIWAASPKIDNLIARGDQEPKFEIVKSK